MALLTCDGVESKLQKEGHDSDFQQNEGHDVTYVTCNTERIIYFPLWYPATVSDGRIR